MPRKAKENITETKSNIDTKLTATKDTKKKKNNISKETKSAKNTKVVTKIKNSKNSEDIKTSRTSKKVDSKVTNNKTTTKTKTQKEPKEEKTKKTTTKSKSSKTPKIVKEKTSSKTVTTKSTQNMNTKKNSATKKTTTKKSEILEYYDLPYSYNQTMVKILAQTPTTLFVYWDINNSDREKFIKTYGKNFFEETRPVLIIHNRTDNYSFEVEINDFANSWYLHVPNSKSIYDIELCRKPINNSNNNNVTYNYNTSNNKNYIFIASSNKLESPNNHILFNELGDTVYFRNVKTNIVEGKKLTSLSFIQNMGKIYNIYDIYKKIYPSENIDDASFNNESSFFK